MVSDPVAAQHADDSSKAGGGASAAVINSPSSATAVNSHSGSFEEVEYGYDDVASDNASEPVIINRTESMPTFPDSEISPADPIEEKPAPSAQGTDPEQSKGDQEEDDPELGFGIELKRLEETATQVARDVQEVARGVSTRLTTDLMSATTGITKLAGGLSQWWATLDPPPQAKLFSLEQLMQDSVKPSGELQVLFGLEDDESLIEEFRSKLQQTYACNHNSFTPSVQMAFKGTAYITNKHLCFSVEERSRKIPIKVPLSEVVKANSTTNNPRGNSSEALRLELRNGDWMVLRDFEPQDAADSALALVEHLMGGN